MDRECRGYRTTYKAYVIDDGWNLPKEIVEAIDIHVMRAWKDAYRQVCHEHDTHNGDWLTAEVARQYAAKSWVWRVIEDNQYIGNVRAIGEELQRKYGVTEIEAINIMNGYNVHDYINKYYRIKHRIPNVVDEQSICDSIAEDYLNRAI